MKIALAAWLTIMLLLAPKLVDEIESAGDGEWWISVVLFGAAVAVLVTVGYGVAVLWVWALT